MKTVAKAEVHETRNEAIRHVKPRDKVLKKEIPDANVTVQQAIDTMRTNENECEWYNTGRNNDHSNTPPRPELCHSKKRNTNIVLIKRQCFCENIGRIIFRTNRMKINTLLSDVLFDFVDPERDSFGLG
jgi:hypothetical protein